MNKHKENVFSAKFQLLNSQENSQEINWSSSESSDFETISNNNERFCNLTNKQQSRKRKRKKKVPKNISNLDITFVDVPKDHKTLPSVNKPSISHKEKQENDRSKSPVLVLTPKYFPPFNCCEAESRSPILTSKTCGRLLNSISPPKSPILVSKYRSPKLSPNVRKHLFTVEKVCEGTCEEKPQRRQRSQSLILNKKVTLDRRKNQNVINHFNNSELDKTDNNLLSDRTELIKKSNDNNLQIITKSNLLPVIETNKENNNQESSEESNLEDSFGKMPADIILVKRVQSYFDSHFSSETSLSQLSINSILTPKQNSKTSDDIEIISTITQIHSNRVSSQSEQEAISKNASSISSESAETSLAIKKIKHKKGGLAYRLNALLKKKNANISLWQHERFLAENSNFVIPKGEHLVFRIAKVQFKYGSYLLEGYDPENEQFLIVINGNYVNNSKILSEIILKLYEPYTIVEYKQDCKLIINACKFECISRVSGSS